MINAHLSNWLGFPVKDYTEQAPPKKPGSIMEKLGLAKSTPTAAGSTFPAVDDGDRVIYRLRREWETKASFTELLQAFLSNPSAQKAPALIIGAWMGDDSGADSTELVQLLAEARDQLPLLRGLFIGDILSEECEISWISQCDVSPLLTAYPRLEHLRIRGGSDLSFGSATGHENLKSLIIESGGLPAEVVREVLSLNLPALEHLELWTGMSDYGGDCTVPDLEPLLSGKVFPKLRKLGLRDAEIADDIAEAIAKSPLVDRLSELDLSLGTLSDSGAQHLVNCSALEKLKSLDLHHHYCTQEMMMKLRQAFPGINLDGQEIGDEDDRYVAVGE